MARSEHPSGNFGLVPIAHLEIREQRNPGLVGASVDPPVPGEASRRAIVYAFVRLVLGLMEMLGEGRHSLQIFQGGDGTRPRLAHVATTKLHSAGVGRAETVSRIVAG